MCICTLPFYHCPGRQCQSRLEGGIENYLQTHHFLLGVHLSRRTCASRYTLTCTHCVHITPFFITLTHIHTRTHILTQGSENPVKCTANNENMERP